MIFDKIFFQIIQSNSHNGEIIIDDNFDNSDDDSD